MKILFSFLVLFLLNNCAQLENVDKSLVNHKAMDLKKRATGELTTNCTALNGGGTGSQAGCATCAK
ncbi:MAG: hypothetical protein H6620_05625 [Halobacteriovoraceae bacterium]|nr:hypothetical protein [Halobacteriovoraceae bacterium]